MTDPQLKIINYSITRLLAMREHSEHNLLNKLIDKGLDETLCKQQIEQFKEKNIQSDGRFAEALIRGRARKGQGEVRIRAELHEHKISADIYQPVFAELAIDWFELAERVLLKKYKTPALDDWKEQQKRQRFLQYRGFSMEQIKFAMETFEQDQ
jgi:regulatory protein